jgi:integrase
MVRRTMSKGGAGPTARLIDYKGQRAYGIRWECGKRKGEVASNTLDRDEAVGQKALLLDRLSRGIFPKREADGPGITWADFRKRYRNEHVELLSEGSKSAWTTAANWYESLMSPRHLADVDKATLSKFRGELLAAKKSPNTVATYLRTIRAGLGWAYDMDLLKIVPRVRARKGLQQRSGMRSRPITAEEFERIILAVPKVRNGPRQGDVDLWQRFLRGLWLSSLRVDELRRLSWDAGADLSIDAAGKYPMIRMLAEGHKSRKDCYQPITPEFWALISKPGVQRTGYVFPLPGVNGQQMTRKAVIRVVSAIGKKAGVVTNTGTKKTATSHDIGRRAVLTRLAATMTLSQTQQFARHSDPRTTSEFYIRHEAESLAEAAGWKGVAGKLQTPKTTSSRASAKH